MKSIKRLQKLINNEMTLLKMDNEIQDILGRNDKNSIFDGPTKEFIAFEEFIYATDEGEEISVKFDVIEKNEDLFATIIEISSIEIM